MAALAGVRILLAVSSSAIFSLSRKRRHRSAAFGKLSRCRSLPVVKSNSTMPWPLVE
jgi:hypothetical protein